MELAAAFYISVYSLAALAGGILAWAEYTPSVTIATAPIAILLLFLNERFRVLRLDGGWIAFAGLAAFAYPTLEFFRGDEEFRLLSGAHLLAILQWVLLSYNKTAHQYWWICALSCLQVAIAAVLTNSPVFGVFILIYMFWALWTLSLYTLLLARLRFGRGDESHSRKAAWQWPALTRGEGEPGRIVSSERVATEQSTRNHSHPHRPPHSRTSDFRGSFQCEPHETDLSWRFVFGILGMSAAALMLGMFMFLLTPRLWIGGGNPFQDEFASLSGRRNVTGFSETVQLNEFGRILESSAPVMEVNLFDDATGLPLSMGEALRMVGQNELLLRGTALSIYKHGQWIPAETQRRDDIPTGPSPFSPKPAHLIRQEIHLQPIGSHTLFTLGHPIYLKFMGSEMKAKRQRHTGSISLALRGTTISMGSDYTVWSTPQSNRPPRTRENQQALPHFDSQIPDDLKSLPPIYSQVPADLEQLTAETERVLAPLMTQTVTKPVSQVQIAQALLTYLRDSGRFRYSLERIPVTPNIDPVEDFLLNRKQGHCQYFAAALGLMLRVKGIPTCVVTGFKGGLEDPGRQLIEVQQRHAHAWVEAYIDGNWVTLDPTPSDGREESLQAVGDRLRLWHQLTVLGTTFWNDYVLNLSFNKQQQNLYGPIRQLLTSVTGQGATSSSFSTRMLEFLSEFIRHPEKWFSWQGGLVGFLLMSFIAGSFLAFRSLLRITRKALHDRQSITRDSIRIEFHTRFLALLKPLGFIPGQYQTQREFAAVVASEWSQQGLPAELEPLAQQMAQAFDQLRFGAERLTEREQQQLFTSLEQLQTHLQHSRPEIR